MRTNGLVVNEKGFSRRRSLLWWQDSIAQLPDLILDEPPSGACQLIHAPDAGEIFAVDAFCIVLELSSPMNTAETRRPLRCRSRTSAAASSTP